MRLTPATTTVTALALSVLAALPASSARAGGPGRDVHDLPADVFAPAPRAAITDLAVYPPEIQLTTARDRQSIVVQAAHADGITRDVTKEATFTLAKPGLVRREGSVFRPAADGATTLTVAYEGRKVTVPL